MKKNAIVFIFFVIILLPAIKPILDNDFYICYDYRIQIIRGWTMIDNWEHKNFFAHWSRFIYKGYGSPMFLFYTPLYFYLFAALYYIGIPFFYCFKILNISGFVLTAFSMYYYSKKFMPSFAAVIAGLVFTLAPYHFYEVYSSGQFIEFFSWMLMPPMFYYIYAILKNPVKKNYIILAAIFAIFMLTHHTSIFIFFPILFFILISFIFFQRNFITKKSIFTLSIAIITGALISAYFWIPCISEKQFTWFGNAPNHDFNKCFVSAAELFDIVSQPKDILSKNFNLNLPAFFIMFLFIFYSFRSTEKMKNTGFIFLILFFYGFFFSNRISAPVWNNIKFLHYLEFPFRFLFIMSFASAFLCGLFFSFFRKIRFYQKIIIALIIILFSYAQLYNHIKIFKPEKYGYTYLPAEFNMSNFNKNKLLEFENFTSEDFIFLPKDFKFKEYDNSKFERIEFSEKNISEIKDFIEIPDEFNFSVNSKKNNKLFFNLAYFPGWNVYLNGKKIKFIVSEKGNINVDIPKGNNIIKIKFEDTPIRIFSYAVSIAGVVLFFIATLIFIKFEIKEKRIKISD